MRPLARYPLSTFVLTIVMGTIVLGPLLYFGLASIWPIPFHRAMDRALLISSILALILVRPRLSLRTWWPFEASICRQFLFGCLLAMVSAQAMIGLDLAFNRLTWISLPGSQEVHLLAMSLVAALLVPLVEETLFRGFLQTELVRSLGRRGGWILAAAIYALAHFLKVSVQVDRQPIHGWSGVTTLTAPFWPLMQGDFSLVRAFNLFLVGLILGGIFLRNGVLWVNYGLHSGWILIMLLVSGWTSRIGPPHAAFLGSDLVSSPLTTAVLVVLGLWLWRFYRSPLNKSETGENVD